MEPQESEAVMTGEMKIGQHIVFIDEYRKERDALLTAIHGDPQGRMCIAVRKDARQLTEDEKASGDWHLDNATPPIYAYKHEDGIQLCDYIEPGEHWPCVNLVVISQNEDAQDQYGRQIDERHTSIVHWSDSTAIGYCFRFADEKVDWSKMQPTIS